jgi:mannan endo-1,4-beta-mannosidase
MAKATGLGSAGASSLPGRIDVRKHLLLFVLLLGAGIFGVGSFSQAQPAVLSHSDMDAKRQKVLGFLTELSQKNTTKDFRGSVSGQNCYHGSQILDSAWEKGYANMVVNLHAATGQWVGIVGLDYEWFQIFTPKQLSSANKVLIAHAEAGGLVTINLAPLNPWVNDETDIENNPGHWEGPAGTESKIGLAKVTSLDDLLNPNKAVHAAWMRKLDRIADALAELRNAGVVVLFRPMQEMNGNWYWWGMSSHPNDPGPYIRVYRHMHDYFENEKKLDNLLWVYSPNATLGQDSSSSWMRSVGWAYPGTEFVDIVAGTNYDDTIDIEDYAAYARLGKPLGMAELGPRTDGPAAKAGSWDTHRIIEIIRKKYPRIAYFVVWHSYPGKAWSIVSNADPGALMNDPGVINRDELPAW